MTCFIHLSDSQRHALFTYQIHNDMLYPLIRIKTTYFIHLSDSQRHTLSTYQIHNDMPYPLIRFTTTCFIHLSDSQRHALSSYQIHNEKTLSFFYLLLTLLSYIRRRIYIAIHKDDFHF